MKTTTQVLRIAAVMAAVTALPALAQWATMPEAQNVAENWISLVIHNHGSWGRHENAAVQNIQELRRDARLLGYFCPVDPVGFVVVSSRKELAPVKAYSTFGDLNPELDEGPADFIKDELERTLNAIEARLGPIAQVRPDELVTILDMEFRALWQISERDPATFEQELSAGLIRTDYQEGGVMLTSHWHQRPPYNDDCPNMGCNWPFYGNYNQNARVGCVATAGAQIMRYWGWPPYGEGNPYDDSYNWANMLNMYIWDDYDLRFEDENGNPVTQTQINAVAELCHEVGLAVDMDYGCAGSSAYLEDMEAVYEDHYRYSGLCDIRYRDGYSAVEWFEWIKMQCEYNRPMQYGIPEHCIVVDGWRETSSNDLILREYHINYGWGDPNSPIGGDIWYTLDQIYGGSPDDEFMMEDIFPAVALPAVLNGSYAKPDFPYRYFTRDTTGEWATLEPGQLLQFLPNVTVKCTAGNVRFEGADTNLTRLYTRGDQGRGAWLGDATIKLNVNGMIALH